MKLRWSFRAANDRGPQAESRALLPLPKDIAKAVSFSFYDKCKRNLRHAKRVVGCGSPVETSAKQKHRPSRQARMRVSCGDLCEAEAPTEPVGESRALL